MCRADMIRAKKAGLSVSDYQKLQPKTRTYRNPAYELRGEYEQCGGKTKLFWRAYQLIPFPCCITDIYKSTNHLEVSAELTELLRRARYAY